VNELKVDVEIPLGFRCSSAIHRNFVGVIPLTQRASLGEKILWIGFFQIFIENTSIKIKEL
jgi:hypothetical protein